MPKINWMGELGAALQGVNQALQAYRQQQIQDLLAQLNLRREERQAKLDELRMQRELEEQQIRRQDRAQMEADRQAYADYIEKNKDVIARTAGVPPEMVGLMARVNPQLGMNLLTQTTMEGMRERRPRIHAVGDTLVSIDPETQRAVPIFKGERQGDDVLRRQIALQEWEQKNKLIPVVEPTTGQHRWATVEQAQKENLMPASLARGTTEKKLPAWMDAATDPIKQIPMVNLYTRDPNLAAKAYGISPEDRPVFDAMMDQLVELYHTSSKKDKGKKTKPPEEKQSQRNPLLDDITTVPSHSPRGMGFYP